MRNFILTEIDTALQNYKGFFHTEKEVQIYLTNVFIRSGQFDNVYFEYYIGINLLANYDWLNGNKISIDIVLEKDGAYFPIEIKFKTAKQTFPHFVFGSETNVTLENQAAQTVNRYDFWKDIKRIEILKQNFPNVKDGFVLFISNDPTYRKAPKKDNGGSSFTIFEDRFVPKKTLLNWNSELAVSKGRPGFELNQDYKINWKKMPIENHYYILI